MDAGKNILEITEEKRFIWFGHVKRMSGNRLPRRIPKWEPEGTPKNRRPRERWSVTNHTLTEENTGDIGMTRNLVSDERKPFCSGQTLG
jgi:hypothetical protein